VDIESGNAAPEESDLLAAPPSRDLLTAARQVLADFGYTAAAVRTLLAARGDILADAGQRPVVRRRLEQSTDPAAALVKLLIVEDALETSTAEERLGAKAVDALVAARLLRRNAAWIEPTARVVPHSAPGEDLMLASDPSSQLGRADVVPGVQNPSQTLADLTPRRRVMRALDVGTGCGLQAILLARHADHVVATDVNPRALAYARVNAALCGVDVELRAGSLLEPVAGEEFDLIVSNPPYVLSPESELVFRDSGHPGDSFNQLVARTIPTALAPGGTATILLSWSQPPSAETPAPIAWLAGAPFDVLLLMTGLEDPLSAAASWNRDAAGDPADYARRIDRWTRWYAEQGIDQIGYGALLLRRGDRPPWHSWVSTPAQRGPAGDHALRLLTAHDVLAGTDRDGFLRCTLRAAAGLELRRRLAATDTGWAEEYEVGLRQGLGLGASLDAMSAALVERLGTAGPLTVTDLLPATLTDDDRVAAIGLLRALAEAGLIEVSPPATHG
jgi:methylase of polypeptide subunit release factors